MKDALLIDIGYEFAGWTLKDSGEAFAPDSTPITFDITLAAKIVELNVVVFDTQGSSVTPQVVQSGEKATRPENPTRLGYAFDDWYADEGCTVLFDFDRPIQGITYVYAGWTPTEASYTLNFWVERANSGIDDAGELAASDYELIYATTASGITGTAINPTENNLAAYLPPVSIDAGIVLHFSRFVKGDTATLSNAGDTVINVYYARRGFTYNFDIRKEGGNIYTLGADNQRVAQGDLYSITVTLGQDITYLWPLAVEFTDPAIYMVT